MMTDPYYGSLIPLQNYGETVKELNESLLVGQLIAFYRPLQMEDVAILGEEEVAKGFSEAGVTDPEGPKMVLESVDGNELCFSIAHSPLFYVSGTVAGFLESPDGVKSVVFSEPFTTPLGAEMTLLPFNETMRISFPTEA